MANIHQKEAKVLSYKLRLYDLVDSIEGLNADAVGTAIAGLIEDVLSSKFEDDQATDFIEAVNNELFNHY